MPEIVFSVFFSSCVISGALGSIVADAWIGHGVKDVGKEKRHKVHHGDHEDVGENHIFSKIIKKNFKIIIFVLKKLF